MTESVMTLPKRTSPKPLELTMQLRNNALKARRLALGLTAAGLAAKAGISHPIYCRLEKLRYAPIYKYGSWKPIAVRLGEFYSCEPTELFPEVVLQVQRSTIVATLSEKEAFALSKAPWTEPQLLSSGPDELLEAKEIIGTVIPALAPRLKEILERRLAGWTFEEIGAEYDVSQSRIEQLYNKALRRSREIIATQRLADTCAKCGHAEVYCKCGLR